MTYELFEPGTEKAYFVVFDRMYKEKHPSNRINFN